MDRLMGIFESFAGGEAPQTALILVYFALLGILSVYGLHRYQMLYLYYRHRLRLRRNAPANGAPPSVTVQLPIYNEFYVAGRLIHSVCAMDWPHERFEVQVLDD